MARIRTVKPELVDDETLGRCSREARLLDVWLTTQADDAGRQRGAVALVRSRCFPYDADVSLEDVDRWLDELVAIGRIRRYTAAGEAFVDRPGWHNEQKVDHPSPSRLPSWDDRDTDAARESSREPREPSPLNLGSRTTDQDVISLSDESSSPA